MPESLDEEAEVVGLWPSLQCPGSLLQLYIVRRIAKRVSAVAGYLQPWHTWTGQQLVHYSIYLLLSLLQVLSGQVVHHPAADYH